MQTTTRNPKKQHGNSNKNTRVLNLTHTQFSREQINTLALGPNYALTKNPQNYINELITETEYAIRRLEPKIQNPFRYMAALKNSALVGH
jgi:hypothetical protein